MSLAIREVRGAIPQDRPVALTGLTESEYRDLPGLSQSNINLFLRSARMFHLGINEYNEAMKIGRLMHGAILLGDLDAYIKPETYGPDNKPWNGNANECKAWLREHADKPTLSAREYADLKAAAEYVRVTDGVSFLLRDGHAEVAILTPFGKGRLDYVIDRGTHIEIIDVKTTRDGRFRPMQRTILERGYHVQAAWYRRLVASLDDRPIRYRIIAVELEPLVRSQAWELKPRALDLGDERIDWALERMEECRASGIWPDWHNHDRGPDGTIDLPEYAYPDEPLTGLTAITT